MHKNMNVKEIYFEKIHPDAKEPKKANETDSGWDLTACDNPRFEISYLNGKSYVTNIIYDTGIRVKFALGYCGFVYPRSSIKKYDIFLSNSVGVIDEGYRGSIQCSFRPVIPVEINDIHNLNIYKKGDRIAQLVITRRYEEIDMVEGVVEVDTQRSTGGFGSSGIT
jgi:dUTP pyrophosphatase